MADSEDPPTWVINSATGKVFRHMIDNGNAMNRTNPHPGFKKLSKQGMVQELRLRLANYYGKDLSAPSGPPPIAPLKESIVDVEIGKAQWAWTRQLGQEWIETEAAGKVFKLYPDNKEHSLPLGIITQLSQLLPNQHIPTSSPIMTDKDHLTSLIGAATKGDSASLKQLEYLFPPIPADSNMASVVQITALTSCDGNIEILKHVNGIWEVILQVQDGTVQQLREKYGPKGSSDGKSHNIWPTLGQQISRRKCLFKDFEEEFKEIWNIEDIPKCDKALKEEQEKDCYKDSNGQFQRRSGRQFGKTRIDGTFGEYKYQNMVIASTWDHPPHAASIPTVQSQCFN
ncbi:hypothetical protein M422DRAFT_272395 [Sphaerobolus stellatus SS14]|uniref:Uncharacterized protein n=1 Tax=Sphaerobolus stellatus (strain SS14) TaxID=990650 RepID=A0A0C9TXI9_SPHS4|nr:hypothetical protein M422DRAFT_272395 [Sphaerobolus stellatus SS14]